MPNPQPTTSIRIDVIGLEAYLTARVHNDSVSLDHQVPLPPYEIRVLIPETSCLQGPIRDLLTQAFAKVTFHSVSDFANSLHEILMQDGNHEG